MSQKPYLEDIICAEATPTGVAALSIIRVSGKNSSRLASVLLKIDSEALEGHKAYYSKIKDGEKLIDEVVLTYFEDGKSFTGEESFEINCHGSPLIVSDIMKFLMNLGARLAEPGEFSYRAYLNGKIDLTKAEGIHHTIHAGTDLSKELSLNLLDGGFKNELLEIKELIVWSASRVEASIDFSDQDIELDHDDEVFAKNKKAVDKLKDLLDSYLVGLVQSKGVTFCLTGPPNAGKSTLFNALVGDDRSIVSSEKGTTRDFISESISLFGQQVKIIDTAGLRKTTSSIEFEGIKRSVDLSQKAQLVLFLVSEDSKDDAFAYFNEIKSLETPVLVVETKQDLGKWSFQKDLESLSFSAKNPKDVESLKKLIYEKLSKYFKFNKSLFIERHRTLIHSAHQSLLKVCDFNEISGQEDVISSLLYSALDSLDEVLYIEDPEAVRDQIFKDFCLGK